MLNQQGEEVRMSAESLAVVMGVLSVVAFFVCVGVKDRHDGLEGNN